MSYLEWSNELDVGVEAMNAEHRHLIDRMNRFSDLARGGTRSEALAALADLGAYTVEHFRHEEELMQGMGFPELKKHQGVHRRLLEQFSDKSEEYKRSGDPEDLLMFLKVWLKSHIKGIDTKYGKHAATAA